VASSKCEWPDLILHLNNQLQDHPLTFFWFSLLSSESIRLRKWGAQREAQGKGVTAGVFSPSLL
jgi:hypothetical protein